MNVTKSATSARARASALAYAARAGFGQYDRERKNLTPKGKEIYESAVADWSRGLIDDGAFERRCYGAATAGY